MYQRYPQPVELFLPFLFHSPCKLKCFNQDSPCRLELKEETQKTCEPGGIITGGGKAALSLPVTP